MLRTSSIVKEYEKIFTLVSKIMLYHSERGDPEGASGGSESSDDMSDREDQSPSTPPASSVSDSDEQPPAPPTSPMEGTYNEMD